MLVGSARVRERVIVLNRYGGRGKTSGLEIGEAGGTKAATLFHVRDDKVTRLAPKDIATKSSYEGDHKFAGVEDNYFMTSVLGLGAEKITFQPIAIPPPEGSNPAVQPTFL